MEMDISDLSDEIKSALLAMVMDWSIIQSEVHPETYYFAPTEDDDHIDDFYVCYADSGMPVNMGYSWLVLNWAMLNHDIGNAISNWWWNSPSASDLPTLSPADAQRLWLDKVLALAIEAGKIKVEDWHVKIGRV